MLPPPTQEGYEQRVLGWIREAAMEGSALLKKEPHFGDISKSIEYVNGRQMPIRSQTLSRIVANRTQKSVMEIVSAMTDVRPIWNYLTYDKLYKAQAELLNKMVRAWWKNSNSDRNLQECLKFAAVAGTGYVNPRWNPDLPGGGDIELLVLDPRDVIPIRPKYIGSIQDWQGVIIRQKEAANNLMRWYPTKASKLRNVTESWFEGDGVRNAAGQAGVMGIVSSAWDMLFKGSAATGHEMPFVDFIRVFIKDDTINTTLQPITMGKGAFEYKVYPVGSIHPVTQKRVTEKDARLYPHGRLIICTPTVILDDMPSPYWYEGFPLVRFQLDPVPWSLLGLAPVPGVIPLQDALNEALRGVEDGLRQWVKRGVTADKNAISRSQLEKLDTRRNGQFIMVNPTAGEGIKFIDGPAPAVFDTYFKIIEWLKAEIDDLMGVKGLKELAQLKQMPAADTVQKFLEAQSPLLKLRGRVMEQGLSEVAEQVKTLMFQYYDRRRRVQILGADGGTVVQDYDFDPNQLVPSTMEGAPDYNPDLDSRLPRIERARSFHRNFHFQVAPNSFLEVSHIDQKMLSLQLWRGNALDIWSLWDEMGTPNAGIPPEGSVADRIDEAKRRGLQGQFQGMPSELAKATIAQGLAQAQGAIVETEVQVAQIEAQLQGGAPAAPPQGGGGGAPAAPAAGGGGGNAQSGVGPKGGRPPTGAKPPQLVERSDQTGAPRPAVSESGR